LAWLLACSTGGRHEDDLDQTQAIDTLPNPWCVPVKDVTSLPEGMPKMRKKILQVFPPLETVTKPYLTTDELAHYTNMRPQTWRKHSCYESAPGGLRPLKISNRLFWPTEAVKKLLGLSA
jgi:hypothetical protein